MRHTFGLSQRVLASKYIVRLHAYTHEVLYNTKHDVHVHVVSERNESL